MWTVCINWVFNHNLVTFIYATVNSIPIQAHSETDTMSITSTPIIVGVLTAIVVFLLILLVIIIYFMYVYLFIFFSQPYNFKMSQSRFFKLCLTLLHFLICFCWCHNPPFINGSHSKEYHIFTTPCHDQVFSFDPTYSGMQVCLHFWHIHLLCLFHPCFMHTKTIILHVSMY